MLQEQEQVRVPSHRDADTAEQAFVIRGVSGEAFGRTFTIDRTLTVGRLPVCDIPLHDAGVSRCHVRLAPSADGLLVQDLGSTNGTYVNGHRVAQWIARAGDELRIDRMRFLVEHPRGASPRIPAPH